MNSSFVVTSSPSRTKFSTPKSYPSSRPSHFLFLFHTHPRNPMFYSLVDREWSESPCEPLWPLGPGRTHTLDTSGGRRTGDQWGWWLRKNLYRTTGLNRKTTVNPIYSLPHLPWHYTWDYTTRTTRVCDVMTTAYCFYTYPLLTVLHPLLMYCFCGET